MIMKHSFKVCLMIPNNLIDLLLTSSYLIGRLLTAYLMMKWLSKHSKKCMMSLSLAALMLTSIISLTISDNVYKLSAV